MASILVLGIIGLFIAIIVTLFCVLVLSGLFHKIEVGTKKSPISNLHVAYKFARGSYREIGGLFTEVTAIAADHRCLGVYYDDPKTTPTDNQRCIIGTVLSEGDEEPDKELEERFIARGFKLADFPQVSHMVNTSFPYTTSFSIYIAIYRVYPALQDYVKEKDLCAYPFIELYDKGMIHFLAPLSKQKDFFVPETGDSEPMELSDSPTDQKDTPDLQPTVSDRSGEDSTTSDSSFENINPDTP